MNTSNSNHNNTNAIQPPLLSADSTAIWMVSTSHRCHAVAERLGGIAGIAIAMADGMATEFTLVSALSSMTV